MNIINSELLTSKSDVFWEDLPEIIRSAKNVPVLVISEPLSADSPDSIQLHKMLGACGLSDAQYYILEIENSTSIAWHKLRTTFRPRVVMLFGVSPVQLGISALFRMCEPNKFDDALWLAAPSVAGIEQQPDVKKLLWHSGMKLLFIEKVYGELVSGYS